MSSQESSNSAERCPIDRGGSVTDRQGALKISRALHFRTTLMVLLVGSHAVAVPCGTATAQDSATTVSATTNSPSLDQVRAAGALQSVYRTGTPQLKSYEQPEPNLTVFREEIEPTLRAACYPCHGPEIAEGEFRVDTLNPNLFHGDDVSWWLEVSAVVGNGEMPPPNGPDLADAERKRIIEWLSSEIQSAAQVRRADRGHSSFRRMTRYEYNYALQDLLGLAVDFADDLPPDPITHDGFENSSEMLQMTGKQFGEYLQLNRMALYQATVSGERPQPLHWSVSIERASASSFAELEKEAKQESSRKAPTEDARGQNLAAAMAERNRQRDGRRGRGRTSSRRPVYKNTATGQAVPIDWSYAQAKHAWEPTLAAPNVPAPSGYVAVLPARQRMVVELGNRLPDSGTMRVRFRAGRVSPESSQPPKLALEFGWQADKEQQAAYRISNNLLVIEAHADEPAFYQFDIPLAKVHPRNPVRKTEELGFKDRTNPSEYIRFYNASAGEQADIQIDYVQVSAPVYETWPPKSHSAIFFAHESSDDEEVYASEIIARFMRRAWRRTVTEKEVETQMELFTQLRPICNDFEQAVVETLAAVLSSPRFLYLVQTDSSSSRADHQLSQFELATRLSMFLWCSLPDEPLLDLAAQGQLSDPEELIRQTQRMLADPRCQRFSRHFVHQWLNMSPLEFVSIDRRTYPQYDDSLREAMWQEPIALFEEMLQNDSSVIDFIHCNYAVVNERLARHYRIGDVAGDAFRKVSLKPDDVRGGLLTQAGVLAMNSDGKESHPLKRGMWLLESILNDPPPPPPPAVPEIDLADPEIAKLTPKQQLADHRNKAACTSCHAKIDPWGIAFENFDALGNWRTQFAGKDIDASSLLYGSYELDGVDGVKRYLLANRQDQFVRAIVHKMSTFALGRPLTFDDRASTDRLTAELRREGDGLQTLIRLLVTSDLFRHE